MSLSVPTWAIPNLPTTSRMADQPTISSIEEWMHFFVVKTTILNVFKLPKTTRKKKQTYKRSLSTVTLEQVLLQPLVLEVQDLQLCCLT